MGEETCFAKHPLRWLGHGVLEADRPLEFLNTHLDQAEDLLDTLENALELSGLPADLWDTFAEIRALIEFAVRARPLAERQLLAVLMRGPTCDAFDAHAKRMDELVQALENAKQKTAAWKEPLEPEDTRNALEQARGWEKSVLRFLQPSYWRLRKILRQRYDFTRHAVPPSWTRILTDLSNLHQAQDQCETYRKTVRTDWHTDNLEKLRALVTELRADPRSAHPSVKALVQQLADSKQASEVIENLARLQDDITRLDTILQSLLAGHQEYDFAEISGILALLREQSGALAELSPLLVELMDVPETLDHALRHARVPLNEFETVIGHKSLNQVYRQDRAINRFDGRLLARKMDLLEQHYRNWLAMNARRIRAQVCRKFLERVNLSSLPASQLDPDQKIFKKSYSTGRRDLEHEFGKTMRYKSIRDLAAGDTGDVIQDLKPIWLMSPLSVSDTLPLDPSLFDVVIFDEASQIPVEEAIPAIYRSHQVIVVGDEMQLPPTTFFASARSGEEVVVVEDEGDRFEVDLDSDSFLTQSALNLPSTLLAWHYRSRYESLISFSNAAFYSGNLYTIPDRQRQQHKLSELQASSSEQGFANVDALLARSISFHFMEHGLYEDRRNPAEADYIAQLIRGLLHRQPHPSIGIVAFSEAQQSEIEDALGRLAEEDSEFAAQLENDYVREENDQFCGLFVKNLENVQGDERDIIVMSICYGHDAAGRMLMNFGPINQRGGEKRLNVIFSRAKLHMAVVSSIRHHDITNDYNDGANSLKNFLQYAEAVSQGDDAQARRVLENLNPLARKGLAPASKSDAVVEGLAAALRARGYEVELNVGQSKFRCDLAVRNSTDDLYQLGILIDHDGHYANPNLLDRYLAQPAVLRSFGWRHALVLTKDWYHNPEDVLNRLERILQNQTESTESEMVDTTLDEPSVPPESTPAPEKNTPEVSAPQPVQPSTAPATTAPTVRHLQFIGGSSQKFWEITRSGNSFTVRYGRIGTTGQSQTKTFANEATAKIEADKLIYEKLKKGYEEIK
jgi:predicted DNA-binding WGR domain protein